jgi:hypothetical protein
MQVLVAAGGSSWRHNGKSPAKSASQNLAAVDLPGEISPQVD